MVAVRVMQVAVDEVIHVIAMRDGWVPASRAVCVSAIMGATRVFWSAARRVLAAHLESVLVDVIAVWVMEMRTIKVVGVSIVVHCDMTAAVAVGVRMICMDFMFRFHNLPLALLQAFELPLAFYSRQALSGRLWGASGQGLVKFSKVTSGGEENFPARQCSNLRRTGGPLV